MTMIAKTNTWHDDRFHIEYYNNDVTGMMTLSEALPGSDEEGAVAEDLRDLVAFCFGGFDVVTDHRSLVALLVELKDSRWLLIWEDDKFVVDMITDRGRVGRQTFSLDMAGEDELSEFLTFIR